MRPPWTREELAELLPKIRADIERDEEDYPGAKGLPPMSELECLEMFHRMMDHAHERPLTREECFLHGQLLCQYAMAVRAATLGKPGRYYCFSEDHVREIVETTGH